MTARNLNQAAAPENNLIVNHLPGETWNWLKMNDARFSVFEKSVSLAPKENVPDGITEGAVIDGADKIATGMGSDMAKFVKDADVVGFSADAKVKEPLRLSYRFDGENQTASKVELDLKDGADMVAIMGYYSDDTPFATAGVQTLVHLGKGARLKLVQIHHVGDNIRLLNDVGVDADDDARFELVHIIMDGGESYIGCQADLRGDRSSMKVDIGYLAQNKAYLDMNYFANHLGKDTESEIDVSGVLRDEATKLFRGTIDFKRGAKGGVGNEKEDVLLMDDSVVNKTIPLILCSEEDVEGNHGATIGRLDDELLFYLESRGMSREHIYEMMATSRIASVCRLIPDKETREDLEEELRGDEVSA